MAIVCAKEDAEVRKRPHLQDVVLVDPNSVWGF